MATDRPTKKDLTAARTLGRKFRKLAKRQHPIVADMEAILQQFRALRDSTRGDSGFNRVEMPLWAAFIRAIGRG